MFIEICRKIIGKFFEKIENFLAKMLEVRTKNEKILNFEQAELKIVSNSIGTEFHRNPSN